MKFPYRGFSQKSINEWLSPIAESLKLDIMGSITNGENNLRTKEKREKQMNFAKMSYGDLRRAAREAGVTGIGSNPTRSALETALKHLGRIGADEARGRGRPPKFPTDILVDACSVATSRDEALSILELKNTPENCNWLSVRLSNLRKQGFAVKEFQRGRKSIA